jgi:hypothetical protein
MCVSLLIDSRQETVDKLNWHLAQGYSIVDRFDLGGAFIIILKQP